jgi:hypothetical protein
MQERRAGRLRAGGRLALVRGDRLVAVDRDACFATRADRQREVTFEWPSRL